MTITLTKGLDYKCHICGVALKQQEISAEVNGQYIDYNERVSGVTSIVFCEGCWERYCHIERSDQGDAILKRKELENDGSGTGI